MEKKKKKRETWKTYNILVQLYCYLQEYNTILCQMVRELAMHEKKKKYALQAVNVSFLQLGHKTPATSLVATSTSVILHR